MKISYYIGNKHGLHYDISSDKFCESDSPTLHNDKGDKEKLEQIIASNPDKFKGCEVLPVIDKNWTL